MFLKISYFNLTRNFTSEKLLPCRHRISSSSADDWGRETWPYQHHSCQQNLQQKTPVMGTPPL